ncbi:hypothetical protein Rsub_12757 [Raphidocelis subcapitata]|uniref:PI31 proteasome regulator N-terminal domain-containing protein n=1 Tax=Raphidocelis subcapitata TaxID=307507 RepID=A0A2V0PJX5_9CHLO|nr:hypothetical protein Rsub_12757 [Raphidocelis subcapitata]|eukprot:GBG00027.1 hypothetical protein Rsub_12757 [Raphidocelis subcapitata]
MATPASVLAVVRAAGPAFRNSEDAVVFALHAALLASSFELVGVGDEARLEAVAPDAPEVDAAGWNAAADRYTLLYRAGAGPPVGGAASGSGGGAGGPAPPHGLLLKALPMGGGSMVASLASSRGGEPAVLELSAPDYYDTAAPGAPAARYRRLEDLCARAAGALRGVGAPAAAGRDAAKAAQQPAQRQAQPQPQQQPRRDPGDDPLRIGPPRRPPPRMLGEDDIMPLGGGGPFMPPGLPGMGGMRGPGGLPGMAPGLGGMHVGPGDPLFADRLRHPDLGPGGFGAGSRPGGARWDPISPEGLEGWRPEDFQRPPPGGVPGRGGPPGGARPPTHPDVEQPGPGGGGDWDSMYG